MTRIIVLLLILLTLSGCAAAGAMYNSPDPGAISLGPREEMRLQFGDPERGFDYVDPEDSLLIQKHYDNEGIAGRERAIWLMWIWKF